MFLIMCEVFIPLFSLLIHTRMKTKNMNTDLLNHNKPPQKKGSSGYLSHERDSKGIK